MYGDFIQFLTPKRLEMKLILLLNETFKNLKLNFLKFDHEKYILTHRDLLIPATQIQPAHV